MIMKILKFGFVILISVIISCSPEDSDSPRPEDVFIKYFGVSGSQEAIDVVFNESLQQYFILGSQTLDDNNTNFYYAIATAEGNFVREATIDLTESSDTIKNDVPAALKVKGDVANGEYYVIGTSTNSDDESEIVWTTVNHNLDSTEYFFITNEEEDLIAADIVEISNEDAILIFGTTETVYPGDQVSISGAGKQFYISKVTLQNEVIWEKSSGGTGDDIALDAFELANGGFALFGSTERTEGLYTGTNVLVKFTNSLGTEDGTDAAYGFDSNPDYDDIPSSVIRVGAGLQGSFKITGTSSANGDNSGAFVMGISSLGYRDTLVMKAKILESDYVSESDARLETKANTIVRVQNGDYMVMGSFPNFQTDNESRLEEMMILRTDASGNKIDGLDQWYGLESGNDRANKAVSLPDGKVAVVGTFDFGSGISLIGLLKLNINGELRN